jgi:hypothetical protein
MPTQYHIALGCPVKSHDHNINCGVAVVAKESQGHIVGYRIYQQR